MSIKIAINGFGRIGRAAFKVALTKKNVQIVAINDLTDINTLAHLLQYDTMYGHYPEKITVSGDNLVVGKQKFKILAEREPQKLPWKKMKVDIALECTGFFTTSEKAGAHLAAGAKKVIISAPAKSPDTPTYVLGVNDDKIKKEDKIISNASCTTNCISPVVQVVRQNFGVSKVMMTTIHAYTSTQNIVDGPSKDLRRARAAAQNIIPTSTGAAIAATKTIPELTGLFNGISLRVPVALVSISDFVFLTKKKVTPEEVNNVFRKAAEQKQYSGILAVNEKPLVSSDFIGNSHSAIVDLGFTQVVDGNMLKILAWYDNEWGYSNRLVELAQKLGKK